jgi:HK97 family phage portal protein
VGLFDRINTRAVTWNKFYGGDDTGRKTASGTFVSENSALKSSVVWASATLIADSLAGLTPEAYREDPSTGLRSAVPVPRWVMRPSQTFRRTDVIAQLLLSALLWGNGYALLARRDSDGQVVGMVIVDPKSVECEWDPERKGFRRYRINGKGQWLTEGDMMHIQGATLPGSAKGMSVIAQARESIGLGLTLEEFGARYFGQGSHQKVIIKVPNKILPENEARDLVRQYEQFTRGPGNWHRPSVISGKEVDIVNISIPPEDAQFLQSRDWQALDVARWFRVPPHRVGIISKETSWGSGLAEQNTAMVQATFRPWIDRLEAAFTFYSPGGEDSGVKIALNVSDLLRGSFKDMIDAWNVAVTGQFATPNEARKAIGLDPIAGGDKLVKPPPKPSPNDKPAPSPNDQPPEGRDFLERIGNPYHSKTSGKFATGGGGFMAPAAEHRATIKQAKTKIANAPVPSGSSVDKARKELSEAKLGKGRAGGDSRGGGSKDRRRQRQNLFVEFGGDKKGYVPCHGCGIKTHWADKGEDNPKGYARFERGKIFTKKQGGGYQMPNLLPECFGCNRSRNDTPVRQENLL